MNKKEKFCVICNNKYYNSWEKSKFCSHKCRKLNNNKKSGRTGLKNISSSTSGAISEMICAADLMHKGYPTFRALSPSCLCDLITIIDDQPTRVEVRTGYITDTGKIYFNKKKDDNGRQDVFAVFLRVNNSVHYFNAESEEIDL